ncbi:hypothetical protein FJ414_23365 [Mesorhizobium sp. B3-1-6]|uniref:hypothetical protein n=1 Tax=Mesorhizobium sp. B3-1-6 TaxID=2589895 RepID=UPI001128B7CA|nr:hypothetical protein [Mesorhizobium sp. B3-1-6]TPI31501.1 hypothetical protein FJ414_23365 [Mesorhizobium sp. B3-1-6]
MSKFSKIVGIGMFAIFFALIVLIYLMGAWKVTDSIALPALAITGIVVLLGSLALVAVTFSYMGIGDKTQALALPEGSVRAVIALCLLVLFAILSIYLYGKLASPQPIQSFTELTAVDKDNLIKSLSPIDVVGVTGSDDKGFTVYVRQSVRAESVDFAKQILVMLGTLVASISSFYFGSRTAESTTSKGTTVLSVDAQPNVSSVSPSTIVRSPVAKSLLIFGQNLGGIQNVSLTNGTAVIRASGVTATPGAVTCDVKVGTDAPAGTWSISLSDAAGKTFPASQTISVS